MNPSLDERANRARQSIGDTTEAVTIPEFDPPGRSIGTVAAVVFAVVLAAGGLYAIAQGDDPRAAEVATDGPDSVAATEEEAESNEPDPTGETEEPTVEPMENPPPVEAGAYLVFDPPPEGFEATIFDLDLDMETGPEEMIPTFDVYGTPSDTPFADGDLLVAAITVAPGEDLVTDPGTPTVEVDGQTIYLEDDEDFNVISWQNGTDGVGLLSRRFTQDELVEIMTGIIGTGEVDTKGLTLLEADADLSDMRGGFAGPGIVLYEISDWSSLPGSDSPVISAIVLSSEPSGATGPSLVSQWFWSAEEFAAIGPSETIDHNGTTVETGVSLLGFRWLWFEVDGVPIEITFVAEPGATEDVVEPLSVADALAMLDSLGTIRGATEAEIEAYTINS